MNGCGNCLFLGMLNHEKKECLCLYELNWCKYDDKKECKNYIRYAQNMGEIPARLDIASNIRRSKSEEKRHEETNINQKKAVLLGALVSLIVSIIVNFIIRDKLLIWWQYIVLIILCVSLGCWAYSLWKK